MADYSEIIKHVIYFGIFVCASLSIGAIVLNILTKNFKFSTSKSKLYGIFFNLSNNGIIGVSLITINYLLLIWCALTMPRLNYLLASVLVTLPLIACIVTRTYKKIPLSIIVSFINSFAVYIMHFLHEYLSGEVEDIYMRIAIFFIIAFAFIYFTYNYINDLLDIVKEDKEKKVGEKNGTRKNS